jgi:dephospho-CoA kinase
MIKLALTGSIAMGKTTVAHLLQQRNIPVFAADDAVHEIYANGKAAAVLAQDFPTAITGPIVDRQKLSAILMAQPEKLAILEAHIHPLVHDAQQAFLTKNRNRPLVVFDVPLLFEKNRQAEFDVTLVVSSDPEIQRDRALARLGMTPEKFDFILSRQWPDHKKRGAADYVIENNGTPAELDAKLTDTLARIMRQTVA